MKARKFDTDFDEGKDVSAALDLSKARRPKQAHKRVNVDFPTWMIDMLDEEAGRLGVTRQSIIKICWPKDWSGWLPNSRYRTEQGSAPLYIFE